MPAEPTAPAAPRRERLAREERIRRRAEYRAVYDAGRKAYGRFLIGFARESAGTEVRLGVTVTRKSGSAVVRNRIRRRLKESFRRSPRRWLDAGRPGLDVVINVRDAAATASFGELSADLDRLLEKLTRERKEGPSR